MDVDGDPTPQEVYEIVEHTADWAVRVRGADFAQFLLHAAQAMNTLLAPEWRHVPLEVMRTLELEAFDRESMLVEWLGELAYLAEAAGEIFREFELQEATPQRLRATVRGGRIAELQKHIKAVTYHNLEVVETAAGLQATIVFDV